MHRKNTFPFEHQQIIRVRALRWILDANFGQEANVPSTTPSIPTSITHCNLLVILSLQLVSLCYSLSSHNSLFFVSVNICLWFSLLEESNSNQKLSSFLISNVCRYREGMSLHQLDELLVVTLFALFILLSVPHLHCICYLKHMMPSTHFMCVYVTISTFGIIFKDGLWWLGPSLQPFLVWIY